MQKLKQQFLQLSIPNKVVVIISCTIFLIATTQDALYLIDKNNKTSAYNGGMIFIFGWLNLFIGQVLTFVIWLTNPFYIAALILFLKNRKQAIYFILAALFCSLLMPIPTTVVVNEAGGVRAIQTLGWGYILWVISIATLLLGILLQILFIKRKT